MIYLYNFRVNYSKLIFILSNIFSEFHLFYLDTFAYSRMPYHNMSTYFLAHMYLYSPIS